MFSLLRPILLTHCSFFLLTPLLAQNQLSSGVKLGGGGSNPLGESAINQSRSWYQDARQAYNGNDLVGADGPLAKLGWELTYTVFQWANHTAVNPGVPFTPDNDVYPYENGRHLIEIICENQQVWRNVEPALADLGASNISHEGYIINAWMPMETTSQAVQIPGIESMRPAFRQTQSGIVTSQGDLALRANFARTLGVDGTGITIGTLSDSFATNANPATTANDDVSSNDLPNGIEVLQELGGEGSDEGRAMMQIIHDLAPGAEQKFFTAFNGQAGFANGIRALDEAGCDIIVDDVFFFAEPFFQNGLIAQAINEVSANGKAYFSAAGNSGRKSYESPFRFTENLQGRSGGILHDFDPGPGVDTNLEFTLPVGQSATFILQWDQPFFSVSGAPGCQSDLDFFITANGAELGTVLTLQGTSRNINGDSLEILSITNPGTIDIDGIEGPDTEFNLAIEGLAGPAPGIMKIVIISSGSNSPLNEFDTKSGTLVGHANAQSALAVAAAPFFQTPVFGSPIPQLEPFSSPGGTPLLFADDGTPLAQALNNAQPRFTAADGANTTFFGQQLNDGDNFPNFFGTSAAAPHAAAVAALMLEKAGGTGSLSPSEIDTLLQTTAIDMNAPGIDEESGAGLIDAEAVLNLLEQSNLNLNLTGNPLLPDVFMDEANQSWLNPNVWDNDAAPSVDFDYVLAAVGNNTMRSSPQGQTAGGNVNFPGNSLTVPTGTTFLIKQTDETASINNGLGNLILDGGQVLFGPNIIAGPTSPILDIADFHVSATTGNILGIADSIRNNPATVNGRLTGPGDLLIRQEDGGGFLSNKIITFSAVNETGYTGKITVQGRVNGSVLLDFNSDVNFRGGAEIELLAKGILHVDQALTFQAGKLSDLVNGTIPPGVYAGADLEALGDHYSNAGGVIIVLESSGNEPRPNFTNFDLTKTAGTLDQVQITFNNLKPGSFYELHRNNDLLDFDNAIDTATPATSSFTFTDDSPPVGKAFYRLEESFPSP